MTTPLIFTLATLAALLYIVSTLALTGRFFHIDGPKDLMSRGLAGVAALLHLVSLYFSVSAAGDINLAPAAQNMSMTNVLSLVAWLMTVSMLISSFYLKNVILLPVVFCFAALSLLLTILLPATYVVNIALKPGIVIHITLSLFAYGTLTIALLYALQVAYTNTQLKEKSTALLHSSLPPLMTVESILNKLLSVGTLLLLIAIVSGGLFLNNMFDHQHIHKTVLTLMAFAVYALGLLGAWQWGWRGRPLLLTAAIGSTLLTLAYFGSRFVREVLL
ncbi:cytochrome C assembly family protein [Alteromonas oceanisediminis]|uniref:cytochrome C assembly family protein n=1 Tax=Alteromonas oceanisediminis TaxID=2836180 RepID=UPI0028F42E97|nr:cytochrome c biogenesis protein CcsA [Alteromonas oceanisediminis]